jgi:eukaryotic-like serine/threonine-protein kinase
MPSDLHGQDTLIEKTLTARSSQELRASITPVDPRAGRLEDLPFEERYEVRGSLGQGGMGEIALCTDRRIGRDIALKLIRKGEDDPNVRARFVREACLQGQLEHPAIVPVYDLGATGSGHVYFTMKRVRGLTLAQVLAYSQSSDAEAAQRFSLSKLLAIFIDVCLAIELAHQKGVIHRDLKPSNIMIGDFGEVYVIDWGVAAIDSRLATGDTDKDVVGTPGYMSPEQQAAGMGVDHRSDIYALGAILFEILTFERFDPTPRLDRDRVEARPSVRAPQRAVPPELEEICVRATRTERGERFTTARELADAVQRYLDGDRDLELRRRLAGVHLRRAEELVAKALEKKPETEESDRAAAMKELGSALALDPQDDRPAQLIARLLLEPPSSLPKETLAEWEAIRKNERRTAAKNAPRAAIGFVFAIPIVWAMGVRDPLPIAVMFGAILLMTGLSLYDVRRDEFSELGRNRIFLCGMFLCASITRVFGPLFVVPGVASAVTLPFLLNSKKHHRPFLLAGALGSFLVPFALEYLGVLAKSYEIREGALCVLPGALYFPEIPTMMLLALFGILSFVIGSIMVLRLQDTLRDAELQVRVHAWHLRRLAPSSASGSSAPAQGR